MKKIKVRAIDEYTLELLEDASSGDIIDLRELTEINTELVINKVKEGLDDVYKDLLAKERESLKKDFSLSLNEELESYKNEILKLKENIKQVEINKTLELENKYQVEITKLTNEINKAKQDKDLEYINLINEKDNRLRDLISKHEMEKSVLNVKLESLEANANLIKDKELAEQREILNKEIRELEDKVNQLSRQRSSLNVKEIGEDLETWCDNEYHTQAIAGLSNVTWEKDNEVIGRGKADFVYKVYASDELKEEELLTSVILEMKSEDPESTNQQDINKMLAKLDRDRNNKNIEYAFLVSELGQTSNNSLPIKKVLEYEKMYMVRPEYFLTLLNIVTSFGLTYKDLLLAKEEERIKFKDFETILEEFEEMKSSIVDTTIRHINNQLDIIIKQSDNIKQANQKLLDAAELILNRHIKTVENKINDFRIRRITDKIKELE